MPLTTLYDIQTAVIDRVEAASGLLPIKLQSKKFEHNDKPYADLMIEPTDTQIYTINSDLLTGFILVNIYMPQDSGPMYPAQEGQKFLDLFPRDLVFDHVRIIKTGVILSPKNKGAWDFTPVLIEYEAHSCRH